MILEYLAKKFETYKNGDIFHENPYSEEGLIVLETIKDVSTTFGISMAEAGYYFLLWEDGKRRKGLVTPGRVLPIKFNDDQIKSLGLFLKGYSDYFLRAHLKETLILTDLFEQGTNAVITTKELSAFKRMAKMFMADEKRDYDTRREDEKPKHIYNTWLVLSKAFGLL